MDELAAWLRLSMSPGIGNEGARRLLASFGLPASIFKAAESALRHLLSATQIQALASPPPSFAAQWALTQQWLDGTADRAQSAALPRRLLTLADPDYPRALLQMQDPPLLLYLLGRGRFGEETDALNPAASVAIVGSRNPTRQGADNAHGFARALVGQGWSVVSGMALGIDGAAHQGALDGAANDAHAATLAVVGTGLDRVYPSQHRELAQQIAEHGLLVSEYHLGTPPLSANFPRRNRLIAGLSCGTLVVEAALQSGSLITARMALEQGKEVFAIPGSIHSVQSRGCHALIKQGAKLVESAQDVLEDLGWQSSPGGVAPELPEDGGDKALLDALGHDPVALDALQARTGLDTATLQAQLLMLELAGRVARLPGGLFQRVEKA